MIERVLLLRRDDGNWEIRFRREPWWRRRVRAWREDRAALELAELDERTLKDIGLDRHAGCAFAARVGAYREQEFRRIPMTRLGLMW